MSASFAKLKDGSWGVRFKAAVAPPIGTVLTVAKKDGTTTTATVSAVVWSGPDRDGGTVHLCSIKAESKRCGGVRSGGRETCANCGRIGTLVEDLEDGLLKHYGCCDIPP